MNPLHEPVRSEFGFPRLRELLGVRPDPVAWIEWAAHEAEDLLRNPYVDVEPDAREDRLLIALARLERCDQALVAAAGATTLLDELRSHCRPTLPARLAAAVEALAVERWFDAVHELRDVQDGAEDGHAIDQTIDLLMALDDADLLLSWAIADEIVDVSAWDPVLRAAEFVAERGSIFMEAGPWLLSLTAAIGTEVPEQLEATVDKFVDWLGAIEDAWEAAAPQIVAPIPGLFERLVAIGAGVRGARPWGQLLGDWLATAKPQPAIAAASVAADDSGPMLRFRDPAGGYVATLYLTGPPDANGGVVPRVRVDNLASLSSRTPQQVRFGSLQGTLVGDDDGRFRATLPRVDARRWQIECAATEPQLVIDDVVWPRTQ
ncbi:MAG TPA: hypothetical protein PLI18_06080 [Pirellulaceae bacterium]|nr:hypothetical protein [Pirellulaceae bacterium]